MEFRKFSTTGVVLSRRNYGEADRLVTVYSKEYGKMVVLAKGVRKPKSRKRGSLEIFNAIRFSGSKSHGIPIIEEVEVVESYSDLRKEMKKVAVAYYFMEVISKLTREGERNELVYEIITHYLGEIKLKRNLRQPRLNFIHDILIELGFWPEGRIMEDPDRILEEIVERKISSVRVGKRILS